MSDVIETDYLVVGAGAASMAFTGSLIAHWDASVTLGDRRHAPVRAAAAGKVGKLLRAVA